MVLTGGALLWLPLNLHIYGSLRGAKLVDGKKCYVASIWVHTHERKSRLITPRAETVDRFQPNPLFFRVVVSFWFGFGFERWRGPGMCFVVS